MTMPTVYQNQPVTATIDEAPVVNPGRVLIALTVRELDAASFCLDVSVLANRQVQQRRKSTFDLFSSEVRIRDLEIAFPRWPAG